jgi:hypothetical protein
MANVNNAHGFRPLMRSMTGGPGAGGLGAHKLAGDGTALFLNDVVKLAANGTKNTKCITAGTAGAPATGVNLVYGAASTATDHLIIPADSQLFECQIDTIAAANLDMNAALVAGAGSSITHLSGHSANGVATTNTLDLKVLELWNSPDNAFGAYARIIVKFNNFQLANQLVGV